MKSQTGALLLTLFLSFLIVLADYFLKKASQSTSPLASKAFYIGMVINASTSIGWVYVMRHMTLAYVGVFYSVFVILMLCAVGYYLFNEPLNGREMAGVALAIISLVLLVSKG